MKRFRTKKVAIVVVASALGLGLAGGALAYFTSTGSGTSQATVGTATGWTVNGGSVAGTLYPVPTNAGTGATPDGVVTAASVVNASATANQELNTVVAQITAVGSSGTYGSESACSISDYQLYSPTSTWTLSTTADANDTATINPGIDEAPGGTYNISDLDVALVDNGHAQDNCQGQTVTITLSAS